MLRRYLLSEGAGVLWRCVLRDRNDVSEQRCLCEEDDGCEDCNECGDECDKSGEYECGRGCKESWKNDGRGRGCSWRNDCGGFVVGTGSCKRSEEVSYYD